MPRCPSCPSLKGEGSLKDRDHRRKQQFVAGLAHEHGCNWPMITIIETRIRL